MKLFVGCAKDSPPCNSIFTYFGCNEHKYEKMYTMLFNNSETITFDVFLYIYLLARTFLFVCSHIVGDQRREFEGKLYRTM